MDENASSDNSSDVDDLEGRVAARRAGLARSHATQLKRVGTSGVVSALVVGAAVLESSNGTQSTDPAGAIAVVVAIFAFLALGLLLSHMRYRRRYEYAEAAVRQELARGLSGTDSSAASRFFAAGRMGETGAWPSLAGEPDLDVNHPPTTSEF